MNTELNFREAGYNDIPLIQQLAGKIWRAHYTTFLQADHIEYMLQDKYSPASLKEQMDEGQVFTLIYLGDKPAGYIAIREKSPGHYFLHKFYIETDLHGKGIGTAAFHYAIEKYCKGFETITLQVNRRNIKSVNFYFRHGFVIDRIHDFDIGNGTFMDDFVMILYAK